MQANSKESLAAIYKAKAAEGLLDCKFFVRGRDETGVDVLHEEALRLEKAIENGDVFPLDFRDLPSSRK